MNPTKRRSGYGILDLRHQVARRIQQEWEMVEQPDAPRSREVLLAPVAPTPPAPPPPKELRPLAA